MGNRNQALLTQRLTDPARPTRVLGREGSGAVWRNLGLTLDALASARGMSSGHSRADSAHARYRYSREVSDAVLAFQVDEGHDSKDGRFGPGTRARLVRVLVDRNLGGIASRLLDPERCVEVERFFTDPEAPDQVLVPFHAEQVCLNICRALAALEARIPETTTYDDRLRQAVMALQSRFGHRTVDGHFGPGTRRLLACRLLEVVGQNGLERLEDPLDPSVTHPPCPAYAGPEPSMFLSYAHRDAHTVFEDMAVLRASGHRIWFDEAITPGSIWNEEIQKQLQTSVGVILYVSPWSVSSPQVREEISKARELGKPIYPVFTRPPDMQAISRAFGPSLASVQAVSRFLQPQERSIGQIATILEALGAGP